MKQRREGKDEREMGLPDFYIVAAMSASWGCQTDYWRFGFVIWGNTELRLLSFIGQRSIKASTG